MSDFFIPFEKLLYPVVEDCRPDGEAVLESARLSVALDRIDEAFIAFDTAPRFTRLNRAAIALLGRSSEGLIGRPPEGVFGEHEPMIIGYLREVLRTGEAMWLDLSSGAPGGRPARMRIFPYPGGVGMTVRSIVAMRDAERGGRERASLARARLVHGGVGVGRLSPRATLEAVDPTFADMAGLAAERLIGARLVDLLSPPSRPMAAEMIEAVLTGQGARAFNGVLAAQDRDGRAARLALAELREGPAISGAVVMLTPSWGDADRA